MESSHWHPGSDEPKTKMILYHLQSDRRLAEVSTLPQSLSAMACLEERMEA